MFSLGKHIKFMRELHRGQTDKIDAPYWRHPLRVMKIINKSIWDYYSETGYKIPPEIVQIILLVALYHDVIEDVENGQERLNKYLLSEIPELAGKIMERVQMLTKPKNMPYEEYIKNVLNCDSELAISVKLTDVRSNTERLHLIKDDNLRQRLTKKYSKWLEFPQIQNILQKQNQEN